MFELPEEEGDVEEEDEDSSLALLDWACEPELATLADGPDEVEDICCCCSCGGGSCGCSETKSANVLRRLGLPLVDC